jgi:chromosome segregation ATPase
MSAVDSQRVFDDAKKFAAQFSGFLKAAELWQSVVSIEQAAEESKKRLAAAQRDETALKDQHAKMQAQAESNAAAALKKADTEAANRKRDADAYVEKRKADVAAEEQKVIDAKRMELAGLTNKHENLKQDHATLVDTYNKLGVAVKDRTEEANALAAKLADLNGKHSALQKKHTDFLQSLGIKAA